MPSSPQTIITRGVFDYLYDTSGKAMPNRTVNVTLNFNAASVTSPIVNVGELQQVTTTDQNGFWRFLLVPNDTLTPTGTLYTVVTPNSSYDVSVPSGGADVQSSSILANVPSVLSPAVTGLTGPVTVTGNETVTGNLSVSGTTTLGSTTVGALTTAAETVGGDLTISSAFRLLFGAAAAKIIPGATSISHRNNADSADNLLIADAGTVTVRNGLTVTAGDGILTAGRLLISSAVAKILGGATSLSLRNTADSADNLLLTDAGLATLRNALLIPPVAAGTLAPTNYGTVPIKVAETVLGAAASSVTFSSLPTGFRNFVLKVTFRADTVAPVDLLLRFNGDATANYDWQEISGSGAVAAAASAAAVTGIRAATSNTITGGVVTAVTSVIYNAQGGSQKNVSSHQCRNESSAVFLAAVDVGAWRSAAALTSLTCLASANNFQTGSVFTLVGEP